MTTTPQYLKEAVDAYLCCALGTDWPEEFEPRTIHNATRATREQATADFLAFVDKCVSARVDVEDFDAEQVGHDFWLTRCGHGAGFWDRPEVYGKANAEKMADIAAEFGVRYPYPAGGKYWGISF